MPDWEFTVHLPIVTVTVQGAILRQVAKRMQASGLLEEDGIRPVAGRSHTVELTLRAGVDPSIAAMRLVAEVTR